MRDQADLSLLDLAQHWLDDMTAAFNRQDFDSFLAGVALPFTLMTTDATLTQTTAAEIRSGFDAFRQLLQSLQATDMIRLALTAERIAPGTVVATYETNLLRHGHRIVPPYLSSVTLGLEGNTWKARSIANGMAATSWPIDQLHVTDPSRA